MPEKKIQGIAANGMEVWIPESQYESWKKAQDEIRKGNKPKDLERRKSEMLSQLYKLAGKTPEK